MEAIRRNILQPIKDLWSLVVGLQITGKFFAMQQVTVHYPRQVLDDENLKSYGGHIELVGKPKEPGVPRCISCQMCAMSCPSSCIKVTKQKAPQPTEEEQKAMDEAAARGEKVKKPAAPKNPAAFHLDYSLCSLCGTCVEVCPVKSLQFSNNIYLAGTSREDFKFDLLKRLRTKAEQSNAEPEALKQ